ncbi:MAG: putative Ig domain-containing protein [Polyangia bacterium]|nr:putative Ig domain-containing protein [Polyangia bacterium]
MRIASAVILAVALLAVPACKKPKGNGDQGEFPPYESIVDPQSLALEGRLQATFGEILEEFDLNGDSEIGADDLAIIDQCLADGATAQDHPECDLDGNGIIDQRDRILFLRLFGEKQPVDESLTLQVADLLTAYGDGTLSPGGLEEVFPDLDGDGQRGGSDFSLAASVLRNDPHTVLDFNGDGVLDRGDTYELLSRIFVGFFGGNASDIDLNGDGVLDDNDAAIVETAVAFTMHTLPGFLDVNQDGKVSIDDYCSRAEHAMVPNFLGAVMTSVAAGEAFEQSPPSVLICREDGRSIFRFEPRRDSRVVLRIVPENLYLEAVATVPDGYHPKNDEELGGAGQLYIVSTISSDIRVEAIDFPWITAQSDPAQESLSVVLASQSFSAGDFLLLPGVAVPLDELSPLKGRLFSPVDKVKAQAKIHEAQLSSPALAQLQEIRQTWSDLDEAIEGIIGSDCPCDIPEGERILLMRRIDMMLDCLRVAQRFAEIWLEAAVLKSQNAAELHIYSSDTSAAMWSHYGQSVWQGELAKVALLFSETATNCATGGAHQALFDSIIKLSAELVLDQRQDNWLQVGDDRRQFITEQLENHILPKLIEEGVGVSADWLGSRGAQEAMSQALSFIQKNRNLPADGKLSAFLQGLGGGNKPGQQMVDPKVVFTLAAIAVDGMVESMKVMAFNAYFQSVADAANYQESLADVALHEAAYVTAYSLRQELAMRRAALLEVFANADEPCPYVPMADEQDCYDAFQSAVETAEGRWADAQEAYKAGIAEAIRDASEETRDDDCFGDGLLLCLLGATNGDILEARVQHESRMEDGSLSCDSSADELNGTARALEDRLDAQQIVNSQCPSDAQVDGVLPGGTIFPDLSLQWESLRQAKSELESALEQAAATRDTCLQSLGALAPCSHSVEFKSSPLGYVQECLDCLSVPSVPCETTEDLQIVVWDLDELVYRRNVEIVLEPALGGIPPYDYSVTGLPSGLSFDPATRTVSGAPMRHGLFQITYGVTDVESSSASVILDIDVSPVLVVDIGGICPTGDASPYDFLRAYGNEGLGEEEVPLPGAEQLVIGDDTSTYSCQPDPLDPVDGVYARRKTVTWRNQTVFVPYCEVSGAPSFGPLYQSFQVAEPAGDLTFDSGFAGSSVDCCANFCPGSCTFQGQTREECCAANPSCYCSWTNRHIASNASFWQQGTHWRFLFEDLQVLQAAWPVVPPTLGATHWVWCTDQRLCRSPLDCTDPNHEINYVRQHAAIVFVPPLERQILGQ